MATPPPTPDRTDLRTAVLIGLAAGFARLVASYEACQCLPDARTLYGSGLYAVAAALSALLGVAVLAGVQHRMAAARRAR